MPSPILSEEKRQLILTTHQHHPDWSVSKIGTFVHSNDNTVRRVLNMPPTLLKETDTHIKIKAPKDPNDIVTHGTLPVDLIRAKVCVALAYLKLNEKIAENALRHLLLACDKCDEYVR